MRVCLRGRERDELTGQVEASVTDQERKELQREQERLLQKMERKGEQINKLHKHRTHVGFHTETMRLTERLKCKGENFFSSLFFFFC